MQLEVLNTEVNEGPPAMAVLRLQLPAANAEIFAVAKPATPGSWYVAQSPVIYPDFSWALNRGEPQIGIPLFPYNVADAAGLFAGVNFVVELLSRISADVVAERVVIVCGTDKRATARRCQWMGAAIWTSQT